MFWYLFAYEYCRAKRSRFGLTNWNSSVPRDIQNNVVIKRHVFVVKILPSNRQSVELCQQLRATEHAGFRLLQHTWKCRFTTGSHNLDLPGRERIS